MLRFTASKLLNRSLALLKGAFLYITGFGGSVYSQTFKIRLLVLFYYLVLRIEIVCRYFALLISASISSFISSYVPSSFASEIISSIFFVRHAKRICQANSFCLICSQFIFDRTLIQSYNQFYNNIFHLRKNISTI